MKATKIVIIAIITALLASFASAKETITFWYGATQDERAAYEKMIADFEKENPDIHVKGLLVPQKYIERKLLLSVAGGVPPDVVRFYAHIGGELMSRGGIESLDEMIKAENFDTSDFFEVGLKQNTYEGKLYGMPWILSPNALFYNKTMFKEAGLDPNRPPRTRKELEEYALKLTKKDAKGILTQVGYADFLYNPNNFMMYLWQSGGELLSEDGKTPTFDSQLGIDTFAWMKDFIDKEAGGVKNLQLFTANFKGAAQDPFGQGKLAMRVDSPFRIPDLKKYFPNLDYGVAPMPYDKIPAAEVVGNSLIIPKNSKHKEAAWRFIKFASSAEQVSAICKVGGRIPARISAAHRPEFYSDEKLRAFVDSIPDGRSVPVVPGWQEVSMRIGSAAEVILKGSVTPEKGLKNAASMSAAILEEANKDMSPYPTVNWKTAGVIAFLILAAVIALVTIYVRRKTASSVRKRKEAAEFYTFLLPWIIGFTVLTFGATVASLIISFTKWDVISDAHFVGFANYKEMFTADPLFWKSLVVTLYYAVFSIPLSIIGGIAVSVLLNQKVFGIKLFRTIYYLPVVVSGVATSVLWLYIFNPTTGLLNTMLTANIVPWFTAEGFKFVPLWSNPPAWLLDPAWSMPAFIIMGVWGIGSSMVVYLAALQGIPEALYESAMIDGASPWKRFTSITLPLMTPAIFYQLVTGTMYSLQMFTQAYMMTNGGPEDSTLFYALYLFRNAFELMKMGYASAMAWILFIIVLIITLIQFKGGSRWVYYESDAE